MEAHPNFNEFVATIARLRSPDGCPWDRAQTHQSIARNMIEEAYEAVDAIESGKVEHLREELGDVLLQVVLQAQIAADAGEFTIDDVCRDINGKMLRRHPHIFGEAKADSADQVLDIWDQVKMQERKAKESQGQEGEVLREGLLESVPTNFPALMQAQKISRKAAAAGFEWDNEDGVWEKVAEEVEEFREAPLEGAELEFGDVLFSLVNVARWRGVDAESALRASCAKFRSRWAYIESLAWSQGKDVADLSPDEMEALWQEAKAHESEK